MFITLSNLDFYKSVGIVNISSEIEIWRHPSKKVTTFIFRISDWSIFTQRDGVEYIIIAQTYRLSMLDTGNDSLPLQIINNRSP